ncbi:hypothetical protein NQU96_21655, partial [Pseudoalteromonas elyakovii]|nr:hypothetical protein [Pseudoalteromonas elyakovii]
YVKIAWYLYRQYPLVITAGSLEIVKMEYEPEDLVLYIFYASRKQLAKKISMFIEHLKHQANLDRG